MTSADVGLSPGDPDRSCADLSFLAAPEALADWRMVLAYEAAAHAGVLAALPGTVTEVAARCDVDEGALGIVLGQLAAWGIVANDDHGRCALGAGAPAWPHDAMLVHHAALIRRWAALLGPRLRDRTATSDEVPARLIATDLGLDLLAVSARRVTRSVVDVCLRRFPDARRVLDLGGGHGEQSLEFAQRGLRVTMQDRPEVIEIGHRRGRLRGAGVELFAGDFFTTLPPGPFDLVVCGLTTSMFDGPGNRDLYRRLRPIIAPGGGLAIVSYLRGRDRVATSFAVQMLVMTEGGDAHGEDDYRRWLAEAGYGPLQVHELDDPPQTIVLAER